MPFFYNTLNKKVLKIDVSMICILFWINWKQINTPILSDENLQAQIGIFLGE